MLLLLLAQGCSRTQEVSIGVVNNAPTPTFNLKKSRGTGFGYLMISNADTKERIWEVTLNNFPGGVLVYGSTPKQFKTFNGVMQNGVQIFPEGSKQPIPLPIKTSFYLKLVWMYDAPFAPGSFRPFYFKFSTDAQGRLSDIVPLEELDWNKLSQP